MRPPTRVLVVVTGVVLLASAVAVGGAGRAAQGREELRSARTRQAKLTAELQLLLREGESRTRALAESRVELSALTAAPTAAADPSAAQAQAWLERVQTLQRVFAEHPELGIPELSLLSNLEWLRVARTAQLETEADMRKSLAAVRDAAKERFLVFLAIALKKHLATSQELPPSPAALLPHFNPPLDPRILDRYEMVRTGKIGEIPANERTRAVLRERAPVDADYDARVGLDSNTIKMGLGRGAQAWAATPDR